MAYALIRSWVHEGDDVKKDDLTVIVIKLDI